MFAAVVILFLSTIEELNQNDETIDKGFCV